MYTEEEARKLVIEAGNRLVENGLVARTWGNVSARISEEEFVITPSGLAYEDLTEDSLVKVRIDDCSYEGDIKPSSEKGIHAAIYEKRKDAHFVVHTHQFFASVISAEERSTPFAVCVKYGLPGTDGLKTNFVKTLSENLNKDTFLLAKHGAVLIGDSMERAFDLAEDLEEKCRSQYLSRVPDKDPVTMAEMNVNKYTNRTYPIVKQARNEYIGECLKAGIHLKPYLDDFAQIVGPQADVVSLRTCDVRSHLMGRNAVLVKGAGAICNGKTEDDVDAVVSILTKNCAAASYVRNASPISRGDSLLQRLVYVFKYSKKKGAKK